MGHVGFALYLARRPSVGRSAPDIYVTRGGEIRVFHRSPLTSQTRISLLGVGSVHATNMRQNQPQVDGRTPTTNSLTSPEDTRATLDERQAHVSALLYLSASVFYMIRRLRACAWRGADETVSSGIARDGERVW